MNQFRTVSLLCMAVFALAACQSLPLETIAEPEQSSAAAQAEPAPVTAAVTPEPIEYGSFSKEQLSRALLNELGGHRGHLQESTQDYYALALETGDLAIIRRASQFATAAGDTTTILALGELWIEKEPESQEPHLMLAFQLMEAGRLEDAMAHMERVLELGGNIDFTTITARTQYLRPQERASLLDSFMGLRARFPDYRSLHYSIIQLLEQNNQPAEAMAELVGFRDKFGATARDTLLEAQLLIQLDRVDDALALLEAGVERYPDYRLMRFNYGRLLVQTQHLQEAREQFSLLANAAPDDYETLYSLALLDLELNALNSARELLQLLLDANYRTDDAHFYLGYVHEGEGRIGAAIDNYLQVSPESNNFLNAQRQVVRLLVLDGRFEEAHTLVQSVSAGRPELEVMLISVETEALMSIGRLQLADDLLTRSIEKYPNNVDLLFARAILSDSAGDMARAEADLRTIIRLQPNDARALNHLGYTLADRTDRYEEALALIERAIAVTPDDPAIIDSLGWAQYKLGRYEEALANLERAYALFRNHEVASHLGEVLWVMGKRRQANRVWEEALQEQPDSTLIKEAMERLRSSAGS